MTIVRQRKDGDCGVAALAQLLGEAYEDVYVAMVTVDSTCRGGRGLYQKDLIAAAKRLGKTLRRRRRVDLDEDEGILSIIWPKGAPYRGHYVTLRRGLIFDPALSVPMDHEDWFRLQGTGTRIGTILALED